MATRGKPSYPRVYAQALWIAKKDRLASRNPQGDSRKLKRGSSPLLFVMDEPVKSFGRLA